MGTNGPYSILFEPVKIGPVTTKNRFYQVPHCCGLGHLRPQTHAAMRGVKAQGGWGVVSTEEAEIHPSSDLSPYPEQRIWDERDIPALRLMTDAVHEHGALAAIELVHNGFHADNLLSKIAPLAPSGMSLDTIHTSQAREMTLRDIKELRQWHRAAALRAKEAGFDIIYAYAGHNMSIAQHFMLPRYNKRTDQYGGSLENRVRLTRELLEDTVEAVGDTCAVAFRFAVDELLGADGIDSKAEGRAIVEMLAEIPDLWDVNIADYSNDSQTSRFQPQEGYQESYVNFVKQVTTKPVVGVGRFTSVDAMVSQVRRGVLDLIGAARPSIADPYIPEKIRTQHIDEIRECIGCNICIASDNRGIPIRCTQNPTIGEEWRRGWHPEKIAPKVTDTSVLVVGAGPAGLECSLQLANRGYQVTLAEAGTQLGGRVAKESQLNGLSSWIRVLDYRENKLKQMANVELYLDSELKAQDILEFGFPHVILATGAHWKRDGVGRSNRDGIAGLESLPVYTPDDIMAGNLPEGRTVIYDDDQAYMAGVLSDHLAKLGTEVIFVTPASIVSPWTENNLEQGRIQTRMIEQGITIHTNSTIVKANGKQLELTCVYSGNTQIIKCDSLVVVTERLPNASLANELNAEPEKLREAGIETLEVIGDSLSPGLIVDAVYAGHLAARSLERDPADIDKDLFRREIPRLDN